MKEESYLLPLFLSREGVMNRILEALMALPIDKGWRVTIQEQRKNRSLSQNSYLWGCVYPTILRDGGEQLRGWTANDLHEYFLGEWSGWEVLEGFGKKRIRPIKRSSRLSTLQFMEFVESIQRRAAELGIVIPDPDPDYLKQRQVA